MNVAQEVVRTLVRMVLSLTPYGVLALMTKVVAGSNYDDILSLISFVMASYVGLGLILVMHLVLVITGRCQSYPLHQENSASTDLCVHLSLKCRYDPAERGYTSSETG